MIINPPAGFANTGPHSKEHAARFFPVRSDDLGAEATMSGFRVRVQVSGFSTPFQASGQTTAGGS